MKKIAVLMLLLFASPAAADCPPNGTPEMVAETKTRMLSDPGFQVTEKLDSSERVHIRNDDGELVIGEFTLENHNAHPAAVVSVVYEHRGSVWVHHEGVTAGDCENFKAWVAQFSERDQELQKMFLPDGR